MGLDIFSKGRADIEFRIFVGNTIVGYWLKDVGFIGKLHLEIIGEKFKSDINDASDIPRLTATGFNSALIIERGSGYFNDAVKNEKLREYVRVFNGKEAVVIGTAVSKVNAQKLLDYGAKLVKATTPVEKMHVHAESREKSIKESGDLPVVESDFGPIVFYLSKGDKLFGIVTKGAYEEYKRKDGNCALDFIHIDIIDYALRTGKARTIDRLHAVNSFRVTEEVEFSETLVAPSIIGKKAHKIVLGKRDNSDATIVKVRQFKVKAASSTHNIKLEMIVKANYNMDNKCVLGNIYHTGAGGMSDVLLKGLASEFTALGSSIYAEDITRTPLGVAIGVIWEDKVFKGVIMKESLSKCNLVGFDFLKAHMNIPGIEDNALLVGLRFDSSSNEFLKYTTDGSSPVQAVKAVSSEIIERYNSNCKDSKNIITMSRLKALRKYTIVKELYTEKVECLTIGSEDKTSFDIKTYEVSSGRGKSFVEFDVTSNGNAVMTDNMGLTLSEKVKLDLSAHFPMDKVNE